MAGVKRKEYPISNVVRNGASKKSKSESEKIARPVTPPSDLEAQTDSDPIVESDTTEHSGDDDGVSWPSDDDEGTNVIQKKDVRSKANGVKLPLHFSKPLEEAGASGNRTTDISNCK